MSIPLRPHSVNLGVDGLKGLSATPGPPGRFQHAMDVLGGVLRRVTIDDGNPEPMTTGPGLRPEPLQVAIFIDRFIGFGHR
jgi:hypothetical protein